MFCCTDEISIVVLGSMEKFISPGTNFDFVSRGIRFLGSSLLHLVFVDTRVLLDKLMKTPALKYWFFFLQLAGILVVKFKIKRSAHKEVLPVKYILPSTFFFIALAIVNSMFCLRYFIFLVK